MAIAQSDTVHSSLGITGKGVNVAVYEDGPDVTTHLSITAQFLANPATDDHARHTHGIIKNIEANKPHGHAPGCNLHSANSMDLAAINWAAPHARLHRDQPELPPRRRADGLGPVLRRHVQGLARPPLAVPDDRAGGRQRLEHRVRQPQGLQQPDRRQPQRHAAVAWRATRSSATRPPRMATASSPRSPRTGLRHLRRTHDERHEHGRPGSRRRAPR